MTERPSDPEIHAQLRAFLHDHPDAVVSVIDSVTYEMPKLIPAGLELGDRTVIDPMVSLGLVDPRDHARLLGFGLQSDGLGIVRDDVLLASDRRGHAVLFDLRGPFGVFVTALVERAGMSAKAPRRQAKLAARIGHYRVSALGRVTEIDGGFVELLGWTLEQLEQVEPMETIHIQDRPAVLEAWACAVADRDSTERARARFRRADDSWMWAELTFENHLDHHGTMHIEVLDISKEMAAEDKLRRRERLLHRLAEALPVGVALVGSRREIVYVNQTMQTLTGRTSVASLSEQLQDVVADDGPRLALAIDEMFSDDIDVDIEVLIENSRTGDRLVCALTMRALAGDDGSITGAIVCVSDVTASVGHRQELEFAATFDPLTGAYNRRSTLAALQIALDRPRSPSSGCALFFIDLNEFKTINDRFGHAAGDELLIETAERLRAVTRSSDIVGRFGGDEFVVVCSDVRDCEMADDLGRRMTERLHLPLTLAGQDVSPSASIGAAWAFAEGIDAKTLLKRADSAMYQAKRDHSRHVRVWEAAPGDAVLHHR